MYKMFVYLRKAIIWFTCHFNPEYSEIIILITLFFISRLRVDDVAWFFFRIFLFYAKSRSNALEKKAHTCMHTHTYTSTNSSQEAGFKDFRRCMFSARPLEIHYYARNEELVSRLLY